CDDQIIILDYLSRYLKTRNVDSPQ
ncbi:hypothetical protein SNE40_018072, partial [Patella caerulea]